MVGERIITVEGVDPQAIYGVNNTRFEMISRHYPKLKLVARGNQIKVTGDEELIDDLESKINRMVQFYSRYSRLTEANILDFLNDNDSSIVKAEEDALDVLVYGTNGRTVKARTINQRKLVELYQTTFLPEYLQMAQEYNKKLMDALNKALAKSQKLAATKMSEQSGGLSGMLKNFGN